MVTGGSVVALKYNGGVLVAADTLASYGSLARYEGVSRMAKVGIANDTLLAAGGDYSDYQMILKMIEQKSSSDFAMDDGSSLSPSALHHWLTRIMYQRRSKMDPLWNSVVIAGFRDGKAYLGSADLYGTQYEDNFIATGLGGHMALPLIRKAWREDMTEAEARTLLTDCMRVLFYRDTRASAKIMIGSVSAEGSKVDEPFEIDTFWECAPARRPFAPAHLSPCPPPFPWVHPLPTRPPLTRTPRAVEQAPGVCARRRPPGRRLVVSWSGQRGSSATVPQGLGSRDDCRTRSSLGFTCR